MTARHVFVTLLVVAAPVAADPPRTDVHGDPLPDRALARFGTVRFRIGDVAAAALSADGKVLAVDSGSDLSFWDVDTGRPVRRVQSHEFGRPVCLRFSPDGKQLAHLSETSLHLIDTGTGRKQAALRLQATGLAVAYVPGTKRLALSQDKGDVFFVNSTDGSVEEEFESPETASLLSPSGGYFLGCWLDGLHLVDSRTGGLRCRFDLRDWPEDQLQRAVRPGDQVAALSPDDARLYLVTLAGRLLSFDATTGKRVEELDPPPGWDDENWYAHLALSPDGSVAYLMKTGHATHRRDLRAGRWLVPLPPLPLGTAMPHPDGKRLLVAGNDGVLHRYDLDTGREVQDPFGFDDSIRAVASPGGRLVAVSSGSWDGRLDLLDASGRPHWSVPIGRLPGRPRWSADGRLVACTGTSAVIVCQANTGKVLHTLRSPHADLEFTGLVSFDPGGKRATASLNNGEALAVFDLASGDPARVVRPGLRWAEDVSPDGRTVAFNNGSLGPALFDVPAGRLRVDWRFPPPPRIGCGGGGISTDLRLMQFSPDGSYFVTWEDDDLAVLFDPLTAEPLRAFRTGQTGYPTFALSADGLWLAVGSSDGRLTLWDVPAATRLVEWHVPGIRDLSFAGPGRLVVSCRDTTAMLWDLRPRKALRQPVWDALNDDEDPVEAYRAVWALATNPEGPALLRARIPPARPAPSGPVGAWINQLGADRYRVREEAASALAEFGRRIEPELRAAREKSTSPEVRARLDAILSRIPRERDWDEVVQARAVAAMELAGTPAARKLLAEWAAGSAGSRLTIDARVALNRLGSP